MFEFSSGILFSQISTTIIMEIFTGPSDDSKDCHDASKIISTENHDEVTSYAVNRNIFLSCS